MEFHRSGVFALAILQHRTHPYLAVACTIDQTARLAHRHMLCMAVILQNIAHRYKVELNSRNYL